MERDTAALLDELYAAPFEDFVAKRNEVATALRKGGDSQASSRVKSLAKPSLAAWVVNQLYRHEPKRFEALLESGAELREAQRAVLRGGGSEALKASTRTQRDLASALAARGEQILTEAGQPATAATIEKVTQTLQAVASAGWGGADPG